MTHIGKLYSSSVSKTGSISFPAVKEAALPPGSENSVSSIRENQKPIEKTIKICHWALEETEFREFYRVCSRDGI